MNKEDKYWFFVMKAISAPNESNKYFYYDKKTDMLFSATINGEKILPNYFNSAVVTEKTIQELNTEIEKVKNLDQNIFKLPKLSYNDKVKFLKDYLSKIKSFDFKEYLNTYTNNFSNETEFFFGISFNSEDPTEVFKFDMARGEFLTKKAEEAYTPLGISVDSQLIW